MNSRITPARTVPRAGAGERGGIEIILLILVLALMTHVPATYAATHYEKLKSFGFPDNGQPPEAPLTKGSDGLLYGTTISGGPNKAGVIFRMNPDGSGYTVLHSFARDGVDGFGGAELLEASDGALYGTTSGGGSNSVGTVFRLNNDGSNYRVLHSFGTNTLEGTSPAGGVIEGRDGSLYGKTYSGGANGAGTVFKLNKDGTGYGVIYSFSPNGVGGNLLQPVGRIIQGGDGALYGTTSLNGSSNDLFTVFKLNTDGSGYTTLTTFSPENRSDLQFFAWLIEASDGVLYGSTGKGGTNGVGTVFKLERDGQGYEVLHAFGGPGDGINPWDRLIEGSDGWLYGATTRGGDTNGGGTIFRVGKDGGGYKILHTFSYADGASPDGGLMEGADGALYGATSDGGNNGVGTIFRLNKDGTDYTVVRSFERSGWTGGDGALPAGLISARNGMLFGTTQSGGEHGRGTIFRLNKDGTAYTILVSLGANLTDGAAPWAPLLQASDGDLYGTTSEGGTSGGGTVFNLKANGSGYTILHQFGDPESEGSFPVTALIEARDGALYGSTWRGGKYGSGTIFKLNKDGSNYSVLYSFLADSWPSTLLEGSDGSLYGTTGEGGASSYYGAVFTLNKDGSGFRTLHSFGMSNRDGANPTGKLIEGSNGALYGVTVTDFGSGGGTVFKINRDGTGYEVLKNFAGSDGQNPMDGLIVGGDGELYGTTAYGGSLSPVWANGWFGLGTVFRISQDGSAFETLYSFKSDGKDGQIPQSSLVQGSDGAFYGTTFHGGLTNILFGTGNPPPPAGAGTIFKIFPPETPELIGTKVLTGMLEVTFMGAPGKRYQLFRSTDLRNWTALPPVLMPASGIYTNVDNAPLGAAVYFRSAWTP